MTDQEKAFIEACFKNNLKSIKVCIQHNVNIHIEGDWAILIAARNGYGTLVRYLLENGITDNSAASLGILAYIVNNNDLELATFLINKSDEYKTDRASVTWAASNGNTKALELLLPYITDINWVYCHAAENGHLQTLKFLNDNNIYEYDSEMDLVLNWAALKNQWNIIKYLVDEKIVSFETLDPELKEKYEQRVNKK